MRHDLALYFTETMHTIPVNMEPIIANGINYFGLSGFPLLVGRSRSDVSSDAPAPHPHDLTEVPHRHDFAELAIVVRGQGMQWLNGTDYPITAGDAFLLQGEQVHYFHDRQHLEIINVMYDPKKLALPENELRRMPGYCSMFMLEPAYREEHQFASRLHLQQLPLAHVLALSEEIQQECEAKKAGFEVMARAKLMILIVYLSRAYTQIDTIASQTLIKVGNVISALENDFCKDWKLEELAIMSNMSTSSLLSVFRRATDQTPIDYLVRLRIQRAMELLRQTDLSVTAIAFEVGFNDSNYFTRKFRRTAGLTPSQFRSKPN